MSLQLMRERINQSGKTLYDEQIKDAQDILQYGFKDDVSYNPYIIDYNTSKEVPIKIYDQKYSASYGTVAKFLSAHTNPVSLGDIFLDTKRNEYWLCIESYDVSGIHFDGKLGKCMRFLKWQDEKGVIQEIPVIITSASKYNNGEKQSEMITLGSDQLMIFTQLNDDTVKLDRGMKFLIDENRKNPTAYELTRIDTTLYTYMGKGFLGLIVTESPYNPTEKELELGVCYYKETTTLPQPSDETDILSAYISFSGSNELKVGGNFKTLTGYFTDENNNVTSETGKWEIINVNELSSYLIYNINENILNIKISNSAFPIGGIIRIRFSNNQGTISTYKDFNIVNSF